MCTMSHYRALPIGGSCPDQLPSTMRLARAAPRAFCPRAYPFLLHPCQQSPKSPARHLQHHDPCAVTHTRLSQAPKRRRLPQCPASTRPAPAATTQLPRARSTKCPSLPQAGGTWWPTYQPGSSPTKPTAKRCAPTCAGRTAYALAHLPSNTRPVTRTASTPLPPCRHHITWLPKWKCERNAPGP